MVPHFTFFIPTTVGVTKAVNVLVFVRTYVRVCVCVCVGLCMFVCVLGRAHACVCLFLHVIVKMKNTACYNNSVNSMLVNNIDTAALT